MGEPRHRPSRIGKSTYFGQYITHEGAERLLHYKYHGGDHSIVYKQILTPMNDYLIQYVPLWVAPNVITLTGLIFVSLTHIAMAYYSPSMEGDQVPSWLLWASALALFTYQVSAAVHIAKDRGKRAVDAG